MKYSLVLIDPPWSYHDKAKAGNRGAEFQYPCMSTHELYKMSSYIGGISEKDSVLYMWTTGPMLPDALGTMKFWGFTYKNIAFTWIKTNKKAFDYPVFLDMRELQSGEHVTHGDFMGMGNHTRSNCEFVLLGVKGKGIKRVNASVRSTVISPIREHSRKPDEVRKRLETLYGDVPRVEIFARERFEGWDAIGDAVGSHIEVDVL